MKRAYRDSSGCMATLAPISEANRLWWWIDVSTPRECRGRGIASRLLDCALADADTEGVTLYGQVARMDAEGLTGLQLFEWYQRKGYVQVEGMLLGFITRNPSLHDVTPAR